jgi:thiamine biosynthesis lipoprotein
MGSPCELQLYAQTAERVREVADLVIAEVGLLEARYSRYRDDSLLSAINRAASRGEPVDVDPETASLLNYAQTCYEQSDGLFDITAGLLRQAWSFSSGRLPGAGEIAALLPRVGWDKLSWRSPRLEFAVPGMELDLGGIVKEYAADRTTMLLLDQGMTNGLVNLGGDIRILGPHADGRAWSIGIRQPHRPGGLLGNLFVRQGAVASSGDYERCMVVAGRRYGHILNPRTGWPVTGLAAVTVLAPTCLVAGSACTIAMLVGEAAPHWLQELGLHHLWVDAEGRLGGDLRPSDSVSTSARLRPAGVTAE